MCPTPAKLLLQKQPCDVNHRIASHRIAVAGSMNRALLQVDTQGEDNLFPYLNLWLYGFGCSCCYGPRSILWHMWQSSHILSRTNPKPLIQIKPYCYFILNPSNPITDCTNSSVKLNLFTSSTNPVGFWWCQSSFYRNASLKMVQFLWRKTNTTTKRQSIKSWDVCTFCRNLLTSNEGKIWTIL